MPSRHGQVGFTLDAGPVAISFQRAPKLGRDEAPRGQRSYGALPVIDVSTADRREVLVPVDERESLWLGFENPHVPPVAVRVIIESPTAIDALTGVAPIDVFAAEPQNYIVTPLQAWLEGVQVTDACAMQFVRVADADNQMTVHQFLFVAASLAPAALSRTNRVDSDSSKQHGVPRCDRSGHVAQQIARDPWGVDEWSASRSFSTVRLVSPETFSDMTGHPRLAPLDPRAAYGGWRLP
jgi:hypothetical protein